MLKKKYVLNLVGSIKAWINSDYVYIQTAEIYCYKLYITT